MRKYIIYRHTSPSGKVYIGQTCQSVIGRWGSNGEKYLAKDLNGEYIQKPFASAIKKYGWENFEHEVLFHGCSKELADKLEMAYIKYYKDLGLSYNIALGGGGYAKHVTAEDRKAARKAQKHEYYLRHKDEIRVKHHEYHQAHKDEDNLRQHEYYQNHKDEILIKCKQYYIDNIDERRAYERRRNKERASKESYREYRREYMREYRKQNPDYNERHKERMKKYNHEYRLRKKAETQKTII